MKNKKHFCEVIIGILSDCPGREGLQDKLCENPAIIQEYGIWKCYFHTIQGQIEAKEKWNKEIEERKKKKETCPYCKGTGKLIKKEE